MQVHKRLHQHEVAVLGEIASRQLFRQAAGLADDLGPGGSGLLLGMEAAVLKACGGLPLALQLMGGQVYEDTELSNWEVRLN